MNRVAVLGTPGDNRVALFQAALARAGQPAAHLLTYHQALAATLDLAPFEVLRIESPGKDGAVNRALVEQGALALGQQPPPPVAEKGTLLHTGLWYAGLCAALERVRAAMHPGLRVLNPPADILLMFDKPRCKRHLAARGIPVPPPLGTVLSFEDLAGRMRQQGMRQVFLKPTYGSSAAGIVALRADAERMQAFTTVEVGRAGRLFNTRRIQKLEGHRRIGALVDALAARGLFAEMWLPKAGHAGHVFDLRVVTIGGEVRHRVARLSHSPMTNLHLLNERLPYAQLGLPPRVDDAIRRTCQRVAAAFPDSLYMGIDLLLTPGYRRLAVLEVNAFGDLLKGVTHRGQDTYSAEVAWL